MSDKDSITFDDIEIDLSNFGAAQTTSTMIDTLDTITLTGSGSTITLPTASYSYSTGATVGGITTIGTNSQWTTGTSGYTFTNAPAPTVNIGNNGIDMAAGTDIKIDGKSLKEFMTKMEQRLAILVPDPTKLEKFEALKRAYEHYKTMESLCFPNEEQEEK